MLVMRTYALYNRSHWVLYLLLGIITIGGGLSVVCCCIMLNYCSMLLTMNLSGRYSSKVIA